MKCIVCQSNEVNPMLGKSFCSRICKDLYLRLDLQWVSPDVLRRMALISLAELDKRRCDDSKN